MNIYNILNYIIDLLSNNILGIIGIILTKFL